LFVLISTLGDISVNVLSTVTEIRQQIRNARSDGKIVGLVPTMGALHRGHLSLVDRARRGCDLVVVSIFVNPTQFNEKQDFQNYPRNVATDLALLEQSGCDIAFTPDHSEVYPEHDKTNYQFGELEELWEGRHRPGHFRGVGMVVRRFFEIVEPHKAFFGLKDYQQLRIIKSLVAQFDLHVEIVPVQTERESDGLAMSSRNQLLSRKERAQAPAIFQVLEAVKMKAGHTSADELIDFAVGEINGNTELETEYFGIANPETLQPIHNIKAADHAIALVAVRAGKVRLIDNLLLF